MQSYIFCTPSFLSSRKKSTSIPFFPYNTYLCPIIIILLRMNFVKTRDGHNYVVPFLLVTTLFFLWGFAHSILDVLNKYFQDALDLSKTQSAFIQVVVYGGYFLMALPAGTFIRRHGYRAGVLVGLILYGIGALLFIPGAQIMNFPFFLACLFMIGCGLTFLETSANPYVTVLGNPDASEQRINFSQAFNGLGWIIGPLVGSYFLFTTTHERANIAMPYLIIGIVVLIIAIIFSRVRLPEIQTEEGEETKATEAALEAEGDHDRSDLHVLLHNRTFLFGWLAIFVYVAAQTGVNSFFINYAVDTADINKVSAANILGFGGMGLFFLGRMAGSFAMRYIRAERLLTLLAGIATVAAIAIVILPGRIGFACLLVVYLCESIMFPTIFALALRGLGHYTKIGSSLLIMGIVGGAVAPVLMGLIADHQSMAAGFIIPLLCYSIILLYGLFISHHHNPFILQN